MAKRVKWELDFDKVGWLMDERLLERCTNGKPHKWDKETACCLKCRICRPKQSGGGEDG
jgi:hypothetical protein